MGRKEVRGQVLRKIRFSAAEIVGLEKKAKELIKALKFKGFKARIGGSLAKGTMVKTGRKPDADIFVVFKQSEDISKLEKALRSMKLPGKLVTRHGSRDYFSLEDTDAILEIVPVVENKDPNLAENVTDVSLAHVSYVGGEIKKRPEISDDILLAKAFCQALGVYGAESYIKGFSGYALEVLVLHFGSFETFLRKVGKKRVIDPKKYYKNEREVLRELNESKTIGPLVVVDPTYQYRNIVAGLSSESLDLFMEEAKAYLKSPSTKAFDRREFDKEAYKTFARKRKGVRYVEMVLVTNRQEGDIAGTKCRKFFDFFISELMRNQQKVLRSAFVYPGAGTKAQGFLLVKEKAEILVKGPSIGLEEASNAFVNAHGEHAFKKGKFWYVKESVTIQDVLTKARKVENDMGAGGKIVMFF